MVKSKTVNPHHDISALVVYGMQEKKASDIVRLDLKAINSSVADYFIICNADSATQVKAIADSVEAEVFKVTGEDPIYKEGFSHGEWILLDYIDIVVHIFKTEKRNQLNIEDLWGDAEIKMYKSA